MKRLDVLVVTLCCALFTVDLFDPVWFSLPSMTKWAGLFVLLGYSLFRRRFAISVPSSPVALCFVVYVIAAIGSGLVWSDSSLILDTCLRSAALLLLFCLSFLVYARHERHTILHVWTQAIFWVSLAACYGSGLLVVNAKAYQMGRFFGLFLTANHIAQYAAILAVILLIKAFKATELLVRWTFISLMPLPVYELYASGGRTNIVAALMIGTWIIIYFLNVRMVLTVVLSVLVVGLLFQYVYQQATPVELLRRDYSSLDNRMDIWQVQWETFQKHPFTGFGLGGGTHAVDFSMNTEGRAGGEGSYGDLLTVAGLLGCIPLFVGLIWTEVRLFLMMRRSQLQTSLTEAFAIVTLILLVSIAESWLATMGTMSAVYVWVVLGSMASGSIKRSTAGTVMRAA